MNANTIKGYLCVFKEQCHLFRYYIDGIIRKTSIILSVIIVVRYRPIYVGPLKERIELGKLSDIVYVHG